MGYTVLQANGRDKEGRQIIVPVENRTFPPGLQEREVVSSRNLTWVYIPYMLAGAGSTVRCEEAV